MAQRHTKNDEYQANATQWLPDLSLGVGIKQSMYCCRTTGGGCCPWVPQHQALARVMFEVAVSGKQMETHVWLSQTSHGVYYIISAKDIKAQRAENNVVWERFDCARLLINLTIVGINSSHRLSVVVISCYDTAPMLRTFSYGPQPVQPYQKCNTNNVSLARISMIYK